MNTATTTVSGVTGASECPTAVVVGGGLAGVAAATALAERGVAVTLVEREAFLGGRVGAWPHRLATGDTVEMERGFHAFFRQYYNVRALLRRIDPDLTHLIPLADYPILGPGGAVESFSKLPRRAPWNVVELVRRSPSLGLRDLLRVNRWAALEMLRFDRRRTYARFDDQTASAYLDSLRFPAQGRRMLFDVFAHSFFNPEGEYSAAELLMMFHFYFMGNPEGLVFDVLDEPFSTVLWGPFERYLSGLGVDLRLATSAEQVEREGDTWIVKLPDGEARGGGLVLALDVGGLQGLVARSTALDDSDWRRSIASLAQTRPFAVWRLWLDGSIPSGSHPFVGTTGHGILDNISLFHLFEGESRRWAERTGGAVIELHAYAVPPEYDEARVRSELFEMACRAHPELAERNVVDECFLLRQDCPAFTPGSDVDRPGVSTPFDALTLAGDLVRLEVPSALMERAVMAGFAAANVLLERWGRPTEPIRTIPERGLLTLPNALRRFL